ncbi:MAG: sugar kinase [Planctomycetota bacterium]
MDDTSPRVVTFGEIMLRLSTPQHQRFVQASRFDINYGGGEANVAVSLANYGIDTAFVSIVPSNDIGQAAINSLRQFGIDTSLMSRAGSRLGVYFLETGASQRASRVIYDRADSAISNVTADDVDPEAIFAGASWFHWTGITPALGAGPAAAVAKLCKGAKAMGLRVSCDLNFRAKLWTTKQAQAVMRPLMEHVDVCICNEEDAHLSLGLAAGETNVDAGELNESGYAELAMTLAKQFAFDTVAITLRESFSASRNGWSAMMLDDRDCSQPYRTRVYDIQLVDRVGGGDSFAAGLIAGLHQQPNTRDAIEFAVAASCLKQTIPGDVNLVSRAEVEQLMRGSGSGRVQR